MIIRKNIHCTSNFKQWVHFSEKGDKEGSSNLLAAEFIHGAKEAGHCIEIVNAAHGNIHPCIGCIHCGYEGPCVQEDDVSRIRKTISEADMGMILGAGCGTPAMTRHSKFPKLAYEFGRNLS